MGVSENDFLFAGGSGEQYADLKIAEHNASEGAHPDVRAELDQVRNIAEGKVDAVPGKGLSSVDYTPEEVERLQEALRIGNRNSETIANVEKTLGDKVSKEQGKGLSANDFTNERVAELERAVRTSEENALKIKNHVENSGVHVTAEEKERWDNKPNWDVLRPSVAEAENARDAALLAADKANDASRQALSAADEAQLETKKIISAANYAETQGRKAEEKADLVDKAIADAAEAMDAIEKNAEDIQESLSEAESGRTAAEVQRVQSETERVAAEAERQAGYEQMGNLFANALVGSASGSSVCLDDVSPIEHKADVKVSSKNLIPFPYHNTSKTDHGIECIVNDDGSVVCNGTSSQDGSRFYFISSGNPIKFPKGTYYWSCLQQEQAGVSAWVRSGNKTYRDAGKGIVVNLTEDTELYFYVTISVGTTVENLVLKPQFEKGTIATTYTPYVENLETVTLIQSEVNYNEYEDNKETTYAVNAAGTVDDVVLYSPCSVLTTDTDGVAVECKYNKDSNKVIEKLTNAIISLGGNV